MGDRYTPTDLAWGNSTTFTTEINTNFDEIATLLDSFLSRTDDTNANAMGVDLDMNSNDILNGGAIYVNQLFVDGAQVPSLEDIQDAFAAGQADIDAAVTAAQTAQTAAETAETNAETAQGLAEDAQAAAEAAAAGVDLPSIVGGDAGKQLYVKSDETGYELLNPNSTTAVTAGTGGDFATVNAAISYFQARGMVSDSVTITVLDTGALDNGGSGTTISGINGWLTLTNALTLSGAVTADPLISVDRSTVFLDAFNISVTGVNTVCSTSHSVVHVVSTSTLETDSVNGPVMDPSSSEVLVGETATLYVNGDESCEAINSTGTRFQLSGSSSNLNFTGKALFNRGTTVTGGEVFVTHNDSANYGVLLSDAVAELNTLEVVNNNAASSPSGAVEMLNHSRLKISGRLEAKHPNATLTTTTYVPLNMYSCAHAALDGTVFASDSVGTASLDYLIEVQASAKTLLQTRSSIAVKEAGGVALTKNSFNSGTCLWVSQ